MRISLKNFFRKLLTTGALAAAMWGGYATTAHAALSLTNGSFESPNLGGYYFSAGYANYTGQSWCTGWQAHNLDPTYTDGGLFLWDEAFAPTLGTVTGTSYMGTFKSTLADNNFVGGVGNTATGLYVDQTIGAITAADIGRTFTLSADLIRSISLPGWGLSARTAYADSGITIGFMDASGVILAQNSLTYGDITGGLDLTDSETAFSSPVTFDWSPTSGLLGTSIKAFVGFTTHVADPRDFNGTSVDNLMLTVNPPYPDFLPLTWKGSGFPSTKWSTATGVLNWNNGTSNVAYVDGAAVTFDDSVGIGSTTVDISGADVVPSSVTFDNTAAKTYILTGSNAITGITGLTKNNTGTVIVLNNNTYTGDTTINGGVLQVGDGGTTGSLGTGKIVNNASLVINRGDNITLSTFSGDISGPGSLTKSGAGTLTIDAAQKYTGATNVTEGMLYLPTVFTGAGTTLKSSAINLSPGTILTSDPGAFGWYGNSNATGLTININGATAETTYARGVAYTLTGGAINGSNQMNLGTSGGFNAFVTTHASPTTSVIRTSGLLYLCDDGLGAQTAYTFTTEKGSTENGVDLDIQSNIRDLWYLASIVKEGPGTMRLSGKCTYYGGTAINNGTLELAGGGSLASGTNVSTAAGATFKIDIDTATQTLGTITGTGTTEVVSGTLTATRIVQDTLIIGASGGAAAVPEPSTLVLLAIAALMALVIRKRMK